MPTENSRRRTTLTARLILTNADKILMLAQTKINGDGFTLPGGKIEAFEFAKEALIRESKEEIGISLKKKDLRFAHIIFKKLKGSTEIVFFFVARNNSDTPRIVEKEKFKDCVWFNLDAIPENTALIVKNALERWKEGKTYTELPKAKKKIELSSVKSNKKVSDAVDIFDDFFKAAPENVQNIRNPTN